MTRCACPEDAGHLELEPRLLPGRETVSYRLSLPSGSGGSGFAQVGWATRPWPGLVNVANGSFNNILTVGSSSIG
jgi:hypothetical protein